MCAVTFLRACPACGVEVPLRLLPVATQDDGSPRWAWVIPVHALFVVRCARSGTEWVD